MKIKSIQLMNFRGIKNAKIELDGKCAVLYGINGAGKTTILRAIDLIYANIIGTLLGTRKRLAELELDDINNDSSVAKAGIQFVLDNGEKYFYRRQIDTNSKKTHNKQELNAITSRFIKKYIDEIVENENGASQILKKTDPMPIFVNYGVNRAVLDMPITDSIRKYGRLDAFENAIESKIDFKNFLTWFRQQEDLENEIIARTKKEIGKDIKLPGLEAVRTAMLSMFPEFSSVRFDRTMNTLMFEKSGDNLKLNQLSDGEKCMIALFGDIARRMVIANDNVLVNPLNVSGVVLIDEVDLHLHPSWQREIGKTLNETFPNVQFILTTHSPQVLGGLSERYSVFAIKRENDEVLVNRADSLFGWDTNIILEEAMGTPRMEQTVLEHVEKMYQAYEDENLDEAEKEADIIDNITNGHNDSAAPMRVMISRKRRVMNK
ncbi:Predicted ATP-binding protein involved in virulence [Butyrivibrio proteoclasticus]|uniref:Predicted ATP-binding protein involved in virulence n=1 Tax=Butyrivibrio proteoclasticus TaxID=43305 RepID=A0A1I5PR15_9FIRM|nr:AAA family ATPase [Butyrivibrio proteoclasticus]SFP36270.1 Predicted ATP-binding protein involved in virulence [Butyrivibrio proteoclasticus]